MSTCAAPARSTAARTGDLAPRCRAPSTGAAHPPRRARRAARGADRDASAARRVALPPGAFLQATAAGEASLAALVAEHCAGAESDRRPVRRRRAVCAAARGARARHRCGQRRGCDRRARSAPPRRRKASSRSRLQRAISSAGRFSPAELEALRRRRVRSAAPGRAGAGARARGRARACRGRGLLQSGDLRARCPHPRRRRLPPYARDAGRPVPATRRTWSWWRRFER